MKDSDLLAYVDAELSAEEELIIDEELRAQPDLLHRIAELQRERFLMAETLIEAQAQTQQPLLETQTDTVLSHSASEPSIEILPNEKIFDAYTNNQLSRSQVKELEDQIQSDPIFEQELAEFYRHSFQIAEVMNTKQSQPVPNILNFPDSRAKPLITSSVSPKKTPWLKIAASFAIFGAGTWLLFQNLNPSHEKQSRSQLVSINYQVKIDNPVGEVAVIRGTGFSPISFEQTKISERLQEDSDILLNHGDTIITGSGQAKIVYDDGTTLNLRSYSQVKLAEFKGAKQVLLASGFVRADVTPQPSGKPLLIETPQIQIEVLGTAFILESSQDRTQLEMTEGSVKVEHLQSGYSSDLKAGEWLVAGKKGITFSGTKPQIVSFSLIDTKTKLALPDFNPITPDSVIKLSRIRNKEVTIRANTIPAIMYQVDLELNGPQGYPKIKWSESYFPYLLTKNMTESHWVDAKIYEPMSKLIPGTYSINAMAETPQKKKVTHKLRFYVRP